MARPREFDESQVVDAAAELFWTKGYAGTSVQDLVEATGLQRGSLYGTFGDKRTLYLRALDTFAAAMTVRVREWLKTASDPVDVVRELVENIGAQCAGEMGSRGCFVGNTACEVAPHDLGVRERVTAIFTTMEGLIEGALLAGQERGTFPRERSARGVAAFIICSVQGLTLVAKTRRDNDMVGAVRNEILRTLG